MEAPRRTVSRVLWDLRHDALPVLTLGGLIAGGVAWFAGARGAADVVWTVVTAVALIPAVWAVVEGLRRRSIGSDVIAVLALAGTLATAEYLAGAVIGVMLTGGQALESRAGRRAQRDLGALLSLAPRVAHREDAGGVTTVDVAEVRPGDRLQVRAGEVVPVDGRIEAGPAVLDESTLTGEPLPVERHTGEEARGGTVNAGGPFPLRATTDASSSAYAGVVKLAREAAAETSPFVRLADRYAGLFLPLTLVLAGVAWAVSRDPVRAVAVLVVATPCPLILAAPIAYVSGLSRCARRGVVVKGGGALERLARARVLLFDKTGTVTTGRPELFDVVTRDGVDAGEVLAAAASLDQVSPHVLATAIVRGARDRELPLVLPTEVAEKAGQGVRGLVGGRPVAVGKAGWADAGDADAAWLDRVRSRAAARGAITVFVGIDGRLAGTLLLRDRIRPDAARTFQMLRHTGIDRTVMVTGDREAVARPIADLVGADEVHADQTPAEKVAVVRAESEHAATVMAGDGVNDAPALASAGVGVALGARGATASSEAADVVITVDRLERLAESLAIARRTQRIARQSVLGGMGLSLAAMVVAAFGLLTPAIGAVTQEVIDLAAILGALRALGPGRDRWPRLHGDDADLVRDLDQEHRGLWPRIDALPALADALTGPDAAAREAADAELTSFLHDLAEHEGRDERLLYPAVASALGGSDPTGAMSRAHAEIADLSRRIDLLRKELREDPGRADTPAELRRVIGDLAAVLRLHFTQEEEHYFVLADIPSHSEGHTA
ncbi:heavy metal translocating P-type ATPase [Actinomadura harenae]|uniref:Heavy metal translocating P-type ATPase n=1 Tax=Actinomadura harenae TaxID=2483351 RepID=A0A3M2LZB0_9ACTN|nr:heavy metal translocating P-type ATPase [Actinomadura harenae]RMI42809.1 heavy metal translocating P-type ATPase [Actinomadura harenae]